MRFVPVYERLLKAYGPRHWWPGETPFEVMIGAVLTQNTSWKNVEKAIASLKSSNALRPEKIQSMRQTSLANAIRSSGYFNQKARKLKYLVQWFKQFDFSVEKARAMALDDLELFRDRLLEVHGVGPETADSILCYALDLPFFVVDAYTVRWLKRYRPINATTDYHELQKMVSKEFSRTYLEKDLIGHYNEFHALIVMLGQTCIKTNPLCEQCPLSASCESSSV